MVRQRDWQKRRDWFVIREGEDSYCRSTAIVRGGLRDHPISCVRDLLLDRSSSLFSTITPERYMARKTRGHLIESLSSTLAVQWAGACRMSSPARQMRM